MLSNSEVHIQRSLNIFFSFENMSIENRSAGEKSWPVGPRECVQLVQSLGRAGMEGVGPSPWWAFLSGHHECGKSQNYELSPRELAIHLGKGGESSRLNSSGCFHAAFPLSVFLSPLGVILIPYSSSYPSPAGPSAVSLSFCSMLLGSVVLRNCGSKLGEATESLGKKKKKREMTGALTLVQAFIFLKKILLDSNV